MTRASECVTMFQCQIPILSCSSPLYLSFLPLFLSVFLFDSLFFTTTSTHDHHDDYYDDLVYMCFFRSPTTATRTNSLFATVTLFFSAHNRYSASSLCLFCQSFHLLRIFARERFTRRITDMSRRQN